MAFGFTREFSPNHLLGATVEPTALLSVSRAAQFGEGTRFTPIPRTANDHAAEPVSPRGLRQHFGTSAPA